MAAKRKKLELPRELADVVADGTPEGRQSKLETYMKMAKAREKNVPLGRAVQKVIWGNTASKVLWGGVAAGGVARAIGGDSVQLGNTFGFAGRWAEGVGDYAREQGPALRELVRRG